MTELNPTRWLIVAGVFGVLNPWIVHWSYQNLGFPEAFPMIYVTLLWAGATTSLIATIGGISQISRSTRNSAQQSEATWAFGLGALGLMSLAWVLILGVM